MRFPCGAILLSFVLALALPPSATAQEAASASGQASPLATSLASLLERHGFRPQHLGFQVIDLDNGAVVASHNAEVGFMPASVAKVPTAIAALDVLGPDHRFATRVLSGSRQDEAGVLRGDLVLQGGGDPLLSPRGLLGLCRDLRRNGVQQVTGRFLYDDQRYPAQPEIEASQPATAAYNPGLSALSLDFNLRELAWEQSAEGQAVYLLPATGRPALRQDSSAPRARFVPDGQGDAASQDEGGLSGTWTVPSALGPAGRVRLPEKDPARLTAEVMRDLCAMVGLLLPPPERGAAPAEALVLAEHRGPRVEDAVAAMLEHSNNLVAELVGLAAVEGLGQRPGNLAEAGSLLLTHLDGRYPGLGIASWRLANHSGLSTDSRISPDGLAGLLGAVEASTGGAWQLPELLPPAGRGAGAAGRFGRPETQLNVWAKTGSMHYVSGLAGYIYTHEGDRLAFAIFVNDPERRAAYDREEAEARSGTAGWRARAKALEGDLIGLWLASDG